MCRATLQGARRYDTLARMSTLTIAFLGDIFASPGRMVVQQQLPVLQAEHNPDLVIANAENAARGLGLSPDLYRKIRAYGVDAITLGDHVYREMKITEVLQDPAEPIARPANLPEGRSAAPTCAFRSGTARRASSSSRCSAGSS